MANPSYKTRTDLARLAAEDMRARGLEAEFSNAVVRELKNLSDAGAQTNTDPQLRDCTALLWCSIDNDDSLDLDQLTACEVLDAGVVRIYVAIADVDALVKKGSAIDEHARTNTTSVYTSARIFPMLPERLSTDLTSLNQDQQRLAVVVEMLVAADATIAQSTVYRARVHNHAKLAYDAIAAWIDGAGPLPEAARAVAGMDAQIRTQDAVAQRLRARRHAQGSLEFETFQPRAVFDGERVVGITEQVHNRARQLIEELMIAANICTAHFLASRGGASLRRVVRSPERWLQIVAEAKKYGEVLPQLPDAVALEAFLAKRRAADPLRFPDLSLVIVKLMGSGEYVVEQAGAAAVGHFGLAVRDYTHSTAPNRRYPDLITQRMLKALLAGKAAPYNLAELGALSVHCTRQEDAAKKVERQVRKSEAALLLEPRMGQHFDAIVTGLTDTGTWVRIFTPPAEGRLVSGAATLSLGQLVRVQLVATNVQRGFIDFALL
jgi:exoribonuclease-2